MRSPRARTPVDSPRRTGAKKRIETRDVEAALGSKDSDLCERRGLVFRELHAKVHLWNRVSRRQKDWRTSNVSIGSLLSGAFRRPSECACEQRSSYCRAQWPEL
ncbi:hypothetical protein Mapa_005817 [Marchantia paleacea]|nr:hypothetical protein Mapa_005817 [Marchantia paleacea]